MCLYSVRELLLLYSYVFGPAAPLETENRLRSSRALSSQFNKKVDNIPCVGAVRWTQRLELGCREMDELHQRAREKVKTVSSSQSIRQARGGMFIPASSPQTLLFEEENALEGLLMIGH